MTELLGVDAEALHEQLRAGSSLADIAAEQGVEVQALIDRARRRRPGAPRRRRRRRPPHRGRGRGARSDARGADHRPGQRRAPRPLGVPGPRPPRWPRRRGLITATPATARRSRSSSTPSPSPTPTPSGRPAKRAGHSAFDPLTRRQSRRSVLRVRVVGGTGLEHCAAVPVTFPAHQGLVIGAKLRWPGLIDGTALCVAAATPDLAYPLGAWLGEHSHTTPGLIVWAIPVALVVTAVVRWRAAAGVFAHLPDLGPLRLRSYRVLGVRRPPWWVTAASAAAGAVSHVVIDSFTHAERWGAELLGLGRRIGASALGAGPTWADVLQYVGHLFGSVAFLAALVTIAARGSLERWYGSGRVREARDVTPSLRERARRSSRSRSCRRSWRSSWPSRPTYASRSSCRSRRSSPRCWSPGSRSRRVAVRCARSPRRPAPR